MISTQDKIRIEGNSLFIKMQPLTSVVALTLFLSTESGVVEGVSFFQKRFRYSNDGINFTDWESLTEENILSISVNTSDVLLIELHYLKIEPQSGSSLLSISNIEIHAEESGNSLESHFFNKTVFKEFFENNNVEVLGWYLNVVEKIYNKGILPNYIERSSESDQDFIDLWRSIAQFFAYYVVYARKFQKFNESESLLRDYVEQRGLRTSSENDLNDLRKLSSEFYKQVANRGTICIIDKKSDGKAIDGELLRLIGYREQEDEFIFNMHRSEHFGWNMRNSSPLNRSLHLHDNANKYRDKSFYPTNASLYGGGEIVNDAGKTVLRVNQKINEPLVIKVSSDITYQFSFFIKTDAALTINVIATDKDNNAINLRSRQTGEVSNSFCSNAELFRSDKYLPVNFFLYSSVETIEESEQTSIRQGNSLLMSSEIVYVSISIETSDIHYLYGIRLLPSSTPYSHGLTQVNNWISCFLHNRNQQLTEQSIESYVKRFLIPYNSYIKINTIENISKASTRSKWVGEDPYCEVVELIVD